MAAARSDAAARWLTLEGGQHLGREALHLVQYLLVGIGAETEVADHLFDAGLFDAPEMIDHLLASASDDAALTQIVRLHRPDPIHDVCEIPDVRRRLLAI